MPEACGKHEQPSMDCRVPWGEMRDGSWKGKERLSRVWHAMLKAFVFLPGKKKKERKRRLGGGVLSKSMV